MGSALEKPRALNVFGTEDANAEQVLRRLSNVFEVWNLYVNFLFLSFFTSFTTTRRPVTLCSV